MDDTHAPTAVTERLLATARRVMAPCYAPPAFIPKRGEGALLWDHDDRRYLDFTSGIGVNALGHAHPEVVAAITSQAQRLLHTANILYHEGHIAMCERLVDMSFGHQVFLCNSGTEAMEAAIKAARRYFYIQGDRRAGLVATHGSFHGRSLGALSITGQPTYREGYAPMLPETQLVPFGDVAAMRAAVDRSTAAVVLEPIQGNSGVHVAPLGYLAAVRALCDEVGCLLVFDEIQTGIGRTGRWFGHEHDSVTPDIMTVAKALGGGLPLGAMVATEPVGAALTLGSHGTTFGGNPVACAAGLKTLEIIERDRLLEAADQRGQQLRTEIDALRLTHPTIQEVRGRGLMIGIELACDAKAIRDRCREDGLLVISTKNVIRLLPPLIVSKAQVAEAVEILGRGIGGMA